MLGIALLKERVNALRVFLLNLGCEALPHVSYSSKMRFIVHPNRNVDDIEPTRRPLYSERHAPGSLLGGPPFRHDRAGAAVE